MGPVAVTLPFAAVETTMLAGMRVVAFLVVAPPFAQRGAPGTVKAALALGVALAVAPRLEHTPAASTGAFVGALVLQAAVGAALGFLVVLVLGAVQSAGALVDLFGGFQLASAFDPMSMTSGAPFARLYQGVAIALLFATDGYQVVLGGLVRTFDALPLDARMPTGPVAQAAADGIGQLMLGALQVAGPLVVVLFLADVGLGLLTRVAPALNAFAIGFPLKILLTLALGGFAVLALGGVVDALTGRAVGVLGGLVP